MKKFILLIIFCTSIINAQDAGKTGLSFLKLGFGARSIAMGNLGTANSSDVTALYYNPSMLSEFTTPEIMFTHNQWIQDVKSEMLGVGVQLFGLPVAFGINTTYIPGIEVRTIPGEPVSTFNANYFAGSISTGFYIMDKISVGLTAKYLYEGLLNDESTGFGLDLGAYYKTSVEGLNIGAILRNLGSMNELRNQPTRLPTEFVLGAAYPIDIMDINSSVNLAAEYQNYTGSNESHFGLGAEIIYDGLIALRTGYQLGFENRGISAGLGLKWYNINFDYAMTPFTMDFGISHTISIKFKF